MWRSFRHLASRARRYAALALVVTVLAMTTAGCWDRTELNEIALVMVLGLDLTTEGRLAVTFIIPIPGQLRGVGGGGGGDQSKAIHSETVVADDVSQAFNRFAATTLRRVRFSHLQLVVFGENLARRGLAKSVDFLARWRELRLTTYIAVAKSPVSEVLTASSPIGTETAEYAASLVRTAEPKGLGESTTLRDLLISITNPAGNPALAYLTTEPHQTSGGDGQGRGSEQGGASEGGSERHLRYDGLAAFKADKMVARCSRVQAGWASILAGRHGLGVFTMPDPLSEGDFLTFELRQEDIKAKPEFRDGRPYLKVKVSMEGDIMEATSLMNYTDPSMIRQLEHEVSDYLQMQMSGVVEKLQKEWATDSLGFGRYFKKFFLTEQAWLEFRWQDRFPEADISIEVTFHVRRVGLTWKPVEPRKETGGGSPR